MKWRRKCCFEWPAFFCSDNSHTSWRAFGIQIFVSKLSRQAFAKYLILTLSFGTQATMTTTTTNEKQTCDNMQHIEIGNHSWMPPEERHNENEIVTGSGCTPEKKKWTHSYQIQSKNKGHRRPTVESWIDGTQAQQHSEHEEKETNTTKESNDERRWGKKCEKSSKYVTVCPIIVSEHQYANSRCERPFRLTFGNRKRKKKNRWQNWHWYRWCVHSFPYLGWCIDLRECWKWINEKE